MEVIKVVVLASRCVRVRTTWTGKWPKTVDMYERVERQRWGNCLYSMHHTTLYSGLVEAGGIGEARVIAVT